MESKAERVNALMQKIDNLRDQTDELYQQLGRSLEIEELWPDAFSFGRVTTVVKGNPREKLTFSIKINNGEQKDFDLKEVPFILWPDAVVNDIERIGWNSPYYRRLMEETK